MYGNPYYNNFNQPIPQQPITQNFQLSPTHTGMRFVNSVDDVRKDLVYFETPYFSRDMRFMWIKNVKGEITPYEIKKIEIKDERQIQIEQMEQMQREIEKLKERLNEKSSDSNDNEPIESKKSSNVSNVKSRKN